MGAGLRSRTPDESGHRLRPRGRRRPDLDLARWARGCLRADLTSKLISAVGTYRRGGWFARFMQHLSILRTVGFRAVGQAGHYASTPRG
jgi:hypothetical protein